MCSFKVPTQRKIPFLGSLSPVGCPTKNTFDPDGSGGLEPPRSSIKPSSARCFLLACVGEQLLIMSDSFEIVAVTSTKAAIKTVQVLSDPSSNPSQNQYCYFVC
jgi:hypothetical protein